MIYETNKILSHAIRKISGRGVLRFLETETREESNVDATTKLKIWTKFRSSILRS